MGMYMKCVLGRIAFARLLCTFRLGLGNGNFHRTHGVTDVDLTYLKSVVFHVFS